jgi:hypothetical protein
MIIGLTGYAQSGKDTVAKVLVEQHGFTRIAFADKIREFLYETNPMYDTIAFEPRFVKECVDKVGWEEAKQNPQIRRLLQTSGVAARKLFGDDFWVKQSLDGLGLFGASNYVITDVRFENEAEAIKKYDNSQLWRIKRNGVSAVNAHISESQMDGYPVDQIFTNNGTISDLEGLVNSRMQNLLV